MGAREEPVWASRAHQCMSTEYVYRTIDIERRGYGRRYSWLPVDEMSRTGFVIDLAGSYTQPHMIDIRPGDIVRWREGERLIEGLIADVQRDEQRICATISDAHPLPPEAFHP